MDEGYKVRHIVIRSYARIQQLTAKVHWLLTETPVMNYLKVGIHLHIDLDVDTNTIIYRIK